MLSADGNKPTGKPGQRKKKGEGKKAAEARKRKAVLEAAQQVPQPDQLQDTTEAIEPPVATIEDATISAPALATSPPDASAATATIEAFPIETAAGDNSSAAPEAVSAADVSTELAPAALAAIDWSAASVESVPAPAAETVQVASEEPAPVAPLEAVSVAPVEAASAAPVEAVSDAAVEAAPVSYETIASAYSDLTRRSLDQTTSFFEKFWGVRSLDKVFELQTEFAKQAYENFCAESQRIRDLHRELAKQRLERWEGFVGMTKAR